MNPHNHESNDPGKPIQYSIFIKMEAKRLQEIKELERRLDDWGQVEHFTRAAFMVAQEEMLGANNAGNDHVNALNEMLRTDPSPSAREQAQVQYDACNEQFQTKLTIRNETETVGKACYNLWRGAQEDFRDEVYGFDTSNLDNWRKVQLWMMRDDGYIIRQWFEPQVCCDECLKKFRHFMFGQGLTVPENFQYYCEHREVPKFEAQGKKGKLKQGVRTKKLRTLKAHYDFGNYYNLDDAVDVANYLRDVDTWLWSMKEKLPKPVLNLRKFALSWTAQRPRYIAMQMLAQGGHPVAKLLWSARSGRLSQERRDNWNFNEPQYLTEITQLVYLFIAIIAAYKVFENRNILSDLKESISQTKKEIREDVKEFVAELNLPELGKAATQTTTKMGQTLDTVNQLGSTLINACKDTYQFLNDAVASFMDKFDELHFIVKKWLKRLFYAVLIFLAFEFARTYFAPLYHDVKDWLCKQLGFECVPSAYDGHYQPQGDGDDGNVLYDILDFVRINLIKKPKMKFFEYLGDLPKIVSIAKAIEWICEHMGFLYNAVIECITGELRPRSKMEAEAASFAILIAELKEQLENASNLELFSEEIELKLAALELEQERLGKDVVKKDKMRPVFASRYLQSTLELVKLRQNLRTRKKAARQRPTPVWVYEFGKPGLGKSVAIPQMERMVWAYLKEHAQHLPALAEMTKQPFHNGHVFSFNQDEEFMDGYNEQPFTVIDDIFQSKDTQQRSATAQKLIHMVSPEPYSCRVATIENKAHTYFTSRVIISTSNMSPDKFGLANLGLQDTSALTSRITIAVELTEEGWKFHPMTKVVFDEDDEEWNQPLTLEQISAVVAEAVMARELEKEKPYPDYKIPKFKGTFEASRLRFQAQGSSDDSDSSEEERMMDGLIRLKKNIEFAILKELGVSEQDIFRYMGEFNFDPHFKLDMEHMEESIDMSNVYLLRETTMEGKIRVAARLYFERHMFQDIDPLIWEGAKELEPFHSTMETYGEYRNRVRQNMGRSERIKQKREERKKERRANSGKSKRYKEYADWKERLKDPWGNIQNAWRKLTWLYSRQSDWMWMETAEAKMFAQEFLGAILLAPTKRDPINFDDWLRAHWRENYEEYWTELDDINWDFYEEVAGWIKAQMLHGHYAITHQDFAQELARAKGVPAATSVMTGAAVLGAITAYGLFQMLRLFIPPTAHEPKYIAQGSYDGVGGKTKKTRGAAKRTKSRQSRREKVLNAGQRFQAQGQNPKYDKIMRNMDIIETRVSDHDAKWDDVKDHDPNASSYCLFVFSNYALVPGHVMFAPGQGKKRWFSLLRGQNYHCVEDELEMIHEINGDVYLIKFPQLAERANILGLFADKIPNYGSFDQLIPHIVDTGYDARRALNFACEDKGREETYVNSEYGSYTTDLKFTGIANKKGMCGVPFVSVATGTIVGIHMAGDPSQEVALAASITKEDLIEFDPRHAIVDPIPGLNMKEAQCIEGIKILGAVEKREGSFIPSKSALKRSIFDIKDFPIPETEDGPAHLYPFEKDGKRISPLQVAVGKLTIQERIPECRRILKVHDILPESFNPANVRVVSIEEAVYGIPGYMKSIDFDTSAGYFFKKKGLTRRDLCYDEKGNERIHPELRAEVEKRIEFAKRGVVYPVVFEETLKDEIRSKEKNDKGETRLFSAGDFASFIAQRMYLGTFFIEFIKDPTGSPIGLNINPHSKQWGRLYSRLRKAVEEGRLIGAGDFTNYDMSLKNSLLEAFIRLVGGFFSHEDRIVVVVLIKCNFSGWHIMGIFVFQRPWGTCSGSFITAMFNTFCNWYIHKMAFVYLFSEEEWKVVETSFTGDDSAFSTPPEYGTYNMEYLSKFFWDNYRMKYTSPTKTSRMEISWEELVYLKRQFVLGHMGMMAPLAKKSLANMIKWTDTNQDIRVVQSVINSLLEEAWHYGPEFYQECYDWAFEERRRLGMNFELRTFEELNVLRSGDF